MLTVYAGVFSNGTPAYWSPDVVRTFARRESGVADAVAQLPYSIGYTSIYAAKMDNLPYATVINKAGFAVQPVADAVEAAMDDFLDQMTQVSLLFG
jgi:ABC-type phosphate transport system substrate-binding protein